MNKLILPFFLLLMLNVFSANAQQLVALTSSNELIQIASAELPGTTSAPVPITGIASGQTIVGIDYRPNTGELYALGYNSTMTTSNSQLYILNANTGMATMIGSVSSLNLGSGGIAFDFNPTVDRIRIIGENGQNYRLHPITGAVVATDGNLAYAAIDVNFSTVPAVAACAYTNSYIGSEVTTLFDYDKNLNILASQIPPNAGTLNTIGSSGINATGGSNIGMDIYFHPITKKNIAYVNATVAGMNNLYSLNTATGMVSLIGSIGNGLTNIREIAVKIDRTVPATYPGQLVYGLTRVNRNLISFTTNNPELIRTITPITGVTAGQVIVGMDIRPLDRNLYILGYHDTSSTFQLYSLNKTTGVATAIGSPGTINLGIGQRIGFDFNPTVDRIRVVSTNDNSFRLHPATGALVGTDVSLAYAGTDINAGKNPYISTVAYINSFPGATSTTLFSIDDSNAAFCNIVPPNAGVVNTLSSLPTFNLTDLTNDFDFFYDSTTLQNRGYLAANLTGSMNDQLYGITSSGGTTLIDTIGLGVQLYDIAVQLTYTGSLVNGTTTTQTQCSGSYTWASNNMTYTQSGTYYTGSSGSTDTLVLTIHSNPPINNVQVSSISGTTAVIQWNGVTDLGWYEVRYRMVGSSTWTVGTQQAPALSKQIIGLANSSNYEVQVRGYCSSASVGPWSNLLMFTTLSSCQTPSGMMTTNITSNKATLAWATPMNSIGWYDTRYRIVGSGVWINGTSSGVSVTKGITGLTANANYEWQIRARCNPVPSSDVSPWSMSSYFSTSASLKSNETLGLEQEYNNQITLYPNPVQSMLNIEITAKASQRTLIKVYNITGRLVKQVQTQSESGVSLVTMDMSDIANGLYSIQVWANDQLTYRCKVNKQD